MEDPYSETLTKIGQALQGAYDEQGGMSNEEFEVIESIALEVHTVLDRKDQASTDLIPAPPG